MAGLTALLEKIDKKGNWIVWFTGVTWFTRVYKFTWVYIENILWLFRDM